MSADNWIDCPKCLKKHHQQEQAITDDLAKIYGKVSATEYESRRRRLEDALPDLDESCLGTMREDYEQGLDSSGQYVVSYSCSCSKCGFRWSYKHKQQVI